MDQFGGSEPGNVTGEGPEPAFPSPRWNPRAIVFAAATVTVVVVSIIIGLAVIDTRLDETEQAVRAGRPSAWPSSTVDSGAGPIAQGTPIDLDNATFDLGDFRCGGKVTRAAGKTTYQHASQHAPFLRLLKQATGDVNRDGVLDTVGLFHCQQYQGYATRVVAFTHGPTGAIVTIGTVVSGGAGIESMFDMRVTAAGAVDVEVGDFHGVGGDDEASLYSTHQWRTYSWSGQRFDQTGGPTSFPVNSNFPDVRVTVSALAYGPPDATNTRHGVLRLTIRNAGGAEASAINASIYVHGDTPVGDAAKCQSFSGQHGRSVLNCPLGNLAPGQSRTTTFEFVSCGCDDGIAVPPGDHSVFVTSTGPGGRSELGTAPNEAQYVVTRA